MVARCRSRNKLRIMTPPAQGSRHFNARYGGRIDRIGGVICGRAVAVLALNAGELRGGRLVGETGRQVVTHRVAGQAGTVGLASLSHEHRVGKSAEMGGMDDRVEDFRMALRAGCGSGVLGRWAGDSEEGVAGEAGDGRLAEQAGSAHRLPTGVLKRALLEKLVGARRPVPRHAHPVGDAPHPGHDGRSGHSPGLKDRQMWNALCVDRFARHGPECHGQSHEQHPGCPERSIAVHKPPIVLPQTILAGRRQRPHFIANRVRSSAC